MWSAEEGGNPAYRNSKNGNKRSVVVDNGRMQENTMPEVILNFARAAEGV